MAREAILLALLVVASTFVGSLGASTGQRLPAVAGTHAPAGPPAEPTGPGPLLGLQAQDDDLPSLDGQPIGAPRERQVTLHDDLEPGDCQLQDASEQQATAGHGDPVMPRMAWAALKTGQRFMLVAESPEAGIATLRWIIDDHPRETTVPEARAVHALVLDGLPAPGPLCFQLRVESPQGTVESAWHAVHLANAMRAYDAERGVYTLNLNVLVDEDPVPAGYVEEAIEAYARGLRDATDGYVESGMVLVTRTDMTRYDPGLPCALATVGSALAGGYGPPPCEGHSDVIWGYANLPYAAASTYRDGIQDPHLAIYMNNAWEGPVSTDDRGKVLLHEVGHYAFGALDLYGDAVEASTVGTADCWGGGEGISVMGSHREATEFDDRFNPCPNRHSLSEYTPTWTLLRERFPHVPSRGGPIDPGPGGLGESFHLVTVDMVHQRAGSGDDAGTGKDAPNTPEPSAPIEPGRVYNGTIDGLTGDDPDDWYAFEAQAGQRIETTVTGLLYGCFEITDADGHTLAGGRFPEGCQAGQAHRATVSATAPTDGTYYLRYFTVEPDVYRFGVTLDVPPPSIAWPPLAP